MGNRWPHFKDILVIVYLTSILVVHECSGSPRFILDLFRKKSEQTQKLSASLCTPEGRSFSKADLDTIAEESKSFDRSKSCLTCTSRPYVPETSKLDADEIDSKKFEPKNMVRIRVDSFPAPEEKQPSETKLSTGEDPDEGIQAEWSRKVHGISEEPVPSTPPKNQDANKMSKIEFWLRKDVAERMNIVRLILEDLSGDDSEGPEHITLPPQFTADSARIVFEWMNEHYSYKGNDHEERSQRLQEFDEEWLYNNQRDLLITVDLAQFLGLDELKDLICWELSSALDEVEDLEELAKMMNLKYTTVEEALNERKRKKARKEAIQG